MTYSFTLDPTSNKLLMRLPEKRHTLSSTFSLYVKPNSAEPSIVSLLFQHF